jgi:hypothetical protein
MRVIPYLTIFILGGLSLAVLATSHTLQAGLF